MLESVQAQVQPGSAKAEHDLAYRYLQGVGVAKDEAQAAIWYRKAAEHGYAPAQSALGTLLEILRTYGLFDPETCSVRHAR